MLIDQVQVVRPLENLSTISDLSLLKKHFYGTPILNSILVNGKELDCLIALNDNKLQGDKGKKFDKSAMLQSIPLF
jgi:hypothetical protein